MICYVKLKTIFISRSIYSIKATRNKKIITMGYILLLAIRNNCPTAKITTVEV